MKPNIDYASEIKALLTEKGLNQKELAQELGTTYINVNKTLNGHTMTARDYFPDQPAGTIFPVWVKVERMNENEKEKD